MTRNDSSPVFHGLPGSVPGYYYVMKPAGLIFKYSVHYDPRPS